MTSDEAKKLAGYWRKTAAHDYETMNSLFRSRRYSDCLFFGHIVLEKILKAVIVKNTKNQAEHTHNLLKLANDGGLSLTKEEVDLLDIVNDFNIRARYPDSKLTFYKKCTKPYAEKHLSQIIFLYKKLCQKTNKNS